jgi:hypothetical protein
VSTDVSEEHIASIFRVEEIFSARNQQASRWRHLGYTAFISQNLILFITTCVKISNRRG